MTRPYLGYREGDADTPFGRFYREEMAPLPAHVVEALAVGPQAPELLPGLETAPELLREGHLPVETGYTTGRDGSVRVAVLTAMPGVTAEMWDWWFGWHGCDARRYKLWHPRAHLSAAWADGPDRGRRGRARYVGRTSLVQEYLGSTRASVMIRFVTPADLGLDSPALAPGGGRTTVCARVGAARLPVEGGWLLHDVRPTGEGCEMRSRFWLGGPYVALRSAGPVALSRGLARASGPLLSRQVAEVGRALLVHCAQEMAHLASFLAELHAEQSTSTADMDG